MARCRAFKGLGLGSPGDYPSPEISALKFVAVIGSIGALLLWLALPKHKIMRRATRR